MRRRAPRAARALAALAVASVFAAGCGSDKADLIIYSGRSEALIKPILDEFAADGDLDVLIRFADTTELAATVLEEGDGSRADVFIGQDAGALAHLDERGRLARYDGDGLRSVPARFRSADGTWVGLSARARVVMVNTERVARSEYPRSIFDLTKPRWHNKVAAPNATNASWIGFISELRLKLGDERARRWLEDMKRNGLAVLGSHTDVRNAVGSGEFDAGLVNHYYVELEKREDSPVESVFTDQGDGELGTVVNAASGGILRSADHPEAARRLLDYLLRREVQREFAGRNYEYPVVPGVPAPGLRALDGIKGTGIPLTALGPELDGTLEMIEEVGLGE